MIHVLNVRFVMAVAVAPGWHLVVVNYGRRLVNVVVDDVGLVASVSSGKDWGDCSAV